MRLQACTPPQHTHPFIFIIHNALFTDFFNVDYHPLGEGLQQHVDQDCCVAGESCVLQGCLHYSWLMDNG